MVSLTEVLIGDRSNQMLIPALVVERNKAFLMGVI
jgi:hypothetical protein